MNQDNECNQEDATMNSYNTCLKIMLLTAGCWLAAGVYAQEEDPMMEEPMMEEAEQAAEAATTPDEGKVEEPEQATEKTGAPDEGMADEPEPMAEEGAVAEEGLDEEEGMLEEEGEKLPPLYTNEVELGFGYSSEDSFKFGEYNGLEDEGFFAIGNILLRKNSIIGDDDHNYWEFSGTNLGLDNRNIYLEFSHDGTYGDYTRNKGFSAFFEYDQIPHNQFEDGRTPFIGAGTTNQTLPPLCGVPPCWVPAANTAGMTQLIPSLRNVELETERQRFGGGLKWNFSDHWLAQANYRHEIKDGSDPIGAIFGASGGNPRSSILAVPINYDVDEFNAGIGYTGNKGQASLNYHLSVFDNNDDSVLWTNPNTTIGGWAAGTGYPSQGQLSLFPDNIAHQVNLTGGYNFTPKTRATATVTYSRWLQDQDFLPYSHVHLGSAPALPRNDLDGDIATMFANLSLFSRVTNKLDVTGRYTYDDRNNDTPRDCYQRMQNDSVDTPPDCDTDDARVNWNYDSTRHKFELDAGYRLLPMTKLEVGYAYESKDRNLSEVESTDEHSGKIRLSASPFETINGWIKYTYSTLDGSDYVSNKPFLTGHTQAAIDDIFTSVACGSDPNCGELFENDPLMRKFHFANRDRNHVQGAVIFYPHEKFDFSVNGEYRDDDFGDTEIGLQNSRNYNVTVDVNFHPNEKFNAYAFATHENYKYDQRGYRRDGDPLGPDDTRPQPPGDTQEDFWTTDTEDHINMVGTGIVWAVVEDKFTLNADFTYSRAYTTFEQFAGPALTGGNAVVPLPDVTTKIYNLTLSGDYQIRPNMAVRLKYMYERFTSEDFGLDGVTVNTLSNVILLGNQSPDYNAHVVGLSLIYDF